MAINWSMAAALHAVKENKNEAIIDLGKRFPLTLKALVEAKDNEGAATIIDALPERITARKIESVLKDGVQEIEDEDDIDEQEEKPVKKPVKKKKEAIEEEDEVQDYSEMSARELFDLCKKRGINAKPKQSKEAYIKLLKADEATEYDDEDWNDEEEEKPTKKPVKKEAPKARKKPAKKVVKKVEEDEEEDWDI